MRILLNLHGFEPGSGGVETYLVNLIEVLQKIDSVNEYAVFADRRMEDLFPVAATNFRFVSVDYSGTGWRGWGRIATQRLFEHDLLARHLNAWPADVIHHPLTILNPPGLAVPAVLTFHDLQHEIYPEFFTPSEFTRRRRQYAASVHEARAVIAISAHVKACLVEHYAADPDKIHVVHHGLSRDFRRVGDIRKLQELKSCYQLERPFMLYPAATWPHKNHLRLLESFRLLIDQHGFDGDLILIGATKQEEPVIRKAIETLGLSARVRRLGYLPEGDLPGLLSLARMLVFPSLFEGFGLPVVEAMACGCPVACAQATALREVAGGAAAYFDPVSVEDMVQVMIRVWEDESLRAQLSELGLLRAKQFSWETTASQTLSVYRQVAHK